MAADGALAGADILAGHDAAAFAALRDEVLADARKAAQDPKAFITFVMREEKTNKPVECAPHQCVLLDFVMAHDRCVIMLPIGHAKTTTMIALTLYLLGLDPMRRGAIVSATQDQAEKVVRVVRDYIEQSQKLRLVFPNLRRSTREGDPWTQTKITVERPPGIKDPSLVAVGIDGAISGSRLNWVIVDDILNDQNTLTLEQRDHTYRWFDNSVLDRLDPDGAKLVITNTPWHPDDIVHRCEEAGWATLRMNAYGEVKVQDDIEKVREAEEDGRRFKPWDSEELRPSTRSPADLTCRLIAHDPDPQNAQTLWPGRMNWRALQKERRRHLPTVFNQKFLLLCRDDETSMCQQAYIDLCKKIARDASHYSMGVSGYTPGMLTFTGVDLAVSKRENADEVAIFTFGVGEKQRRIILDIQIGRWPGPEIIRRIAATQKLFNSTVRVENNGCQEFLIQFMLENDLSFPVKSHTTTAAKADPTYGVPGIFLEMSNGAWSIPNDKHKQMHPFVKRFCDACLYYTPSAHTPDVLMAAYFARAQAIAWGALAPNDGSGGDVGDVLVR